MEKQSIEGKARAYDELLDKAKQIYNKENDVLIKHIIEGLFPEFAEPEDERIRKNLIGYIKGISKIEVCEETKDSWIAWLEKQGEHANFRNKIQIGDKVTRNEDGVLVNLSQMNRAVEEYNIRRIGSKHAEGKLAEKIKELNDMFEKQGEQKPDKVEPKFHKGDWIIIDGETMQIESVGDKAYNIKDGGIIPFRLEHEIHLWTIKDAKDGDVLANDHHILILRELGYSWAANGNPDSLYAYCGIKPNGNFELEQKGYCFCGTLHTHPATKEQHDTLMKAMAAAGYTFDFEKKELNKIEQKPADKIEPKFHEGDWVVYDGWTTQIKEVYEDGYSNIHQGFIPKKREEEMRLWTVQDAKDGDVLFQDLMGGKTFIYNGVNPDMAILYSFIISNDGEDVLPYHIGKPNTGIGYIEENKNIIHPATKEQRDLLFQKMKEAGYEWDAEKKELKKVEQKSSEWTEEDERKLESIIDSIRFLSFTHPEWKPVYDGDIEWLNGIKDRIYLQTEEG